MTQYYLPPDPPAGMPAFDGVIRDDWAWIPADPDNRDWAEYQAWLTEGNELKPYDDASIGGSNVRTDDTA